MSEEIKVSLVRSKTAAETFAIEREKLQSTAISFSPLFLLREAVQCYFHDLSNNEFRMYFKGKTTILWFNHRVIHSSIICFTEGNDVMVITTNCDVKRFSEKSTVPRIFVIKNSDVDSGQHLEYIINYKCDA